MPNGAPETSTMTSASSQNACAAYSILVHSSPLIIYSVPLVNVCQTQRLPISVGMKLAIFLLRIDVVVSK